MLVGIACVLYNSCAKANKPQAHGAHQARLAEQELLNDEFIEALKRGDSVQKLVVLVELGAEIPQEALFYANNDVKTHEFLLMHGADINALYKGNTILQHCISNYSKAKLPLIKFFLSQANIDLSPRAYDGATVWHLMIPKDSYCELLLELYTYPTLKQQLNFPNNDGLTPLIASILKICDYHNYSHIRGSSGDWAFVDPLRYITVLMACPEVHEAINVWRNNKNNKNTRKKGDSILHIVVRTLGDDLGYWCHPKRKIRWNSNIVFPLLCFLMRHPAIDVSIANGDGLTVYQLAKQYITSGFVLDTIRQIYIARIRD